VTLRFRLVPADDRFIELFCESAANAAACARVLQGLLAHLDDLPDQLQMVRALERQGDEVTRSIMQRLNTTFVTPFDREDIHALAEELDDVVDDMLAVAALLSVFGVTEILPELKEQADVLVQMSDEAVLLLGKLQSMKGMAPHLEAIDKLETTGDEIYRRALGRLFSGEFKALEVLKWKDVVEAMEAALNTIEDISDIVEAIVFKHA
jgi:predicted phosphate transport protein (TIGR00153 family)